ncbi:MAG: nuclear transport factor 2 family protein [Gemmatimonadetes bacterium]|nr:nuclear transport factor 2 family protein [Gemmatimonadota bacterium]
MRPTSCAVLTLLLGASQAGAQTAQSPLEIVVAFGAAQAAGDTAAVLALMAPDVVIYENGGVEASRDEYRRHHLAADMAFAAAVREEIVDRRSGTAGDIAWVLTQSRKRGSFRGREIESRSTESMVLRRTPDGWWIVHVHWSSARQ